MASMRDSASGDVPIDNDYVSMGYGTEDNSSFFSGRTMATTTRNYRHENGRTYHAYRDGEYWQPNDEKSNNHEALVHHICLMSLDDRLYLAPITDPGRILDLGTGTGIWATDMADRFDGTNPPYPYAEVTGSDLSPIQPGSQPANCTFEVDDCCSEWVYQPETFGYIHIRGLYGSVADWPTLYAEAFRACKPGGWIEEMEWDMALRDPSGQLTEHPVFKQWTDDIINMGERIGKTMKTATLMKDWIREAGFVDVVEKKIKWPLGPWSSDPKLKEIGRWNLLNWEEGLEGWTLAHYTRVLGWDADRVHDWVQQIRKSMRDRKTHVYHEIRVVYARKPLR